ncbi:MAG TPA: glycosyltransferase family 2 protein [Solirubrobacteraceae bacterium]
MTVTVAIPVWNGGPTLERVLDAVRGQRLPDGESPQLLVCDSGSSDGSAALARARGAEVIEIAPAEFSHGGTRNLLMERSEGSHVAFLTQDAVPADEEWLPRLLGGFELADDVALAFGPYLPSEDASPMVARELTEWFAGLSPSDKPRIDRLGADERAIPVGDLLGRRGFFTDANGCVARAAWESVPFRPVRYAEDHVLAHDMLRAGFAKVFVPAAAVVHSHEYSAWGWLQRSFDEARAVHEVYGFQEGGRLRPAALGVWGRLRSDLRWARAHPGRVDGPEALLAARSLEHHLMRAAGTMLGTRADRLPASLVRRLSLERRA